jgi:Na+-translocating ferredoxin:NAD+ oxidoreductase subunit B
MDRIPDVALVDRIDALLPQTQCRRCSEDGCRPYAQAIAAGHAPINRCPPGGQSTIAALAEFLHVPALPLDTSRGTTQPFALAFIDEAICIGCTLCIQVCPTDAIVGAAKQMHTIVADRCTGCELCLPPCPVDCIAMLPAGRDWTIADADRARERNDARRERLSSKATSRKPAPPATAGACDERKAAVAAALARARARRRGAGATGR